MGNKGVTFSVLFQALWGDSEPVFGKVPATVQRMSDGVQRMSATVQRMSANFQNKAVSKYFWNMYQLMSAAVHVLRYVLSSGYHHTTYTPILAYGFYGATLASEEEYEKKMDELCTAPTSPARTAGASTPRAEVPQQPHRPPGSPCSPPTTRPRRTPTSPPSLGART